MLVYAARNSSGLKTKIIQQYMDRSVSSDLGLLHYKVKLAKKAQNISQIQFYTFNRISEMCRAMKFFYTYLSTSLCISSVTNTFENLEKDLW